MSDFLTSDPASDLLARDRLGARFAPAPEILAKAHRRAQAAQIMLGAHGLALLLTFAWYSLKPLADDMAILFATTVVYILTAGAFAAWKVEAYRLAPALGGEPTDRTPGWAAGGYFIPLGNLWIPYQIMREIWDASDPREVGLDEWAERSHTLLVIWWTLWITSGIAAQFFDRLPIPEGEAVGYEVFGLVVWTLGLLVTIAAFLVVRRIAGDQQRLGALLVDAEADAGPEAV